jgi:hypothetical protein
LDQPPSPKRKHVRTGKPIGGQREGAGRKPGSNNALPSGSVQAIKGLKWRVPDGAPPEAAGLADEAFAKIVAVMREEVDTSFGHAAAVLKASAIVREEVCGPIAQKVNHADANGDPLQVSIAITRTVKK